MRSLIRWSATLSIVGTTLLGSWFSQNLKVWALPAEQIVEKLNPVPVFTIADEQGAPLVASGENNAKVAGVFISQQDAEDFVSKLQTEKPELAQTVQVVPVSLGEVYKLTQASESQNNGLEFAYVPDQQEVDSAKTILTENGQQYQGGVPLFVAKGGEQNGYLTIERDSQQVIPFFFEKKQLENVVSQFKQQKPELADTVNIEVVLLEGVIDTLQNSNDEMLNKIVLVPSTESLQFIRENSTEQQEGQTPQGQ
ncbi:hypothetical protein IQ238_04750 [Pleurocapsales cyanobacterium LEGE 06147]|nr:hypothetical protein [Pleurocapsales cyanobacterium LEGE 06147]